MNVIVFGGSGVIGKEVCAVLVKEGYTVFNADIVCTHPYCEYIYTNILNTFSVDKTLKKVNTRGPIYAIINCAYPKPPGYMKANWMLTPNVYYSTFFNQHIVTNISLCKSAIVYNIKNVILLSSIYGTFVPVDELYKGTSITKPPLEYCMSKCAIDYIVKYLAPDLHVNAIAPGGIESPDMDDLFKERYGMFTNPRDIADEVKYLLSDEGKSINGMVIILDPRILKK